MMVGTWCLSEKTDHFIFFMFPVSCFFEAIWGEFDYSLLFSIFISLSYWGALSIFLITLLPVIPVSSSMVVRTFCYSSSSPSSEKPQVTRQGHREYCSWSVIFDSSRILPVWAIWIWSCSTNIFLSSSSTFFLRYPMSFCCSSKMSSAVIFPVYYRWRREQ